MNICNPIEKGDTQICIIQYFQKWFPKTKKKSSKFKAYFQTFRNDLECSKNQLGIIVFEWIDKSKKLIKNDYSHNFLKMHKALENAFHNVVRLNGINHEMKFFLLLFKCIFYNFKFALRIVKKVFRLKCDRNWVKLCAIAIWMKQNIM